MSYDDGRIACTGNTLVIRNYYFPMGAKRIPYGKIAEVRQRPIGLGAWRLWGSSDFVHWYNWDPSRPRKTVAFVVQLSGRTAKPVITPDNPDDVAAELTAHGVTVTASSGG